MNVNLNSISLQQRKFSGTNSIGGIHLPDFNDKYVFSKKKSNTSNVEYKKQIAEQAYEDFKNGQFQNKSEGFNKLMKKYTSEVSPDRKGIITSGLKAVSRNKQSGLKPIDLLATILEGMLMCGKAAHKDLTDSLPLFRLNGNFNLSDIIVYTINNQLIDPRFISIATQSCPLLFCIGKDFFVSFGKLFPISLTKSP